MPIRRPTRLRASDGLDARVSGVWAKPKLFFLDYYVPVALSVTRAFPERWYVDLFAGPGKNIVWETHEEFDGSPLRALGALSNTNPAAGFTHATLVNASRTDHRLLHRRIDALYASGEAVIPRENVSVIHGDSNEWLSGILQRIPDGAYVFTFADITRPSHWPWESVRRLHQRHRNVDLYVLYPIDMGVKRLAAYSRVLRERWGATLTPFFGTDEWAEMADQLRVTDAQAPEFRAKMVKLYITRLGKLWKYSDSVVLARRDSGQPLYEMLFATDAPVANKILQSARKAVRRESVGGQLDLL